MIYLFYLTIGLYLTVFYGTLIAVLLSKIGGEEFWEKVANFLWYWVGSAAITSTIWLFFLVAYLFITGK